jgi:diguanylate cyclase (GGDEF)-like protein
VPWIRHSFAGRLLAAVLVLVLVPAVVLGVFLYDQARSTALDTELVRIQDASRELAGRIDAFVLSQSNLARLGATSVEARAFITGPRDAQTTAAVDEWLRDGPYTTDFVEDAFILDSQGTAIASSNPAFVGESYGIRPYFQEASAGTDSVSDWTIGLTSGEPGIFLASPIRGEYDEVAGVLVIKLETTPIDDLLAQAYAVGTRATLVNGAGVLLSAYDEVFLYRTVDDLTAEESARIESTRQFADKPLPSLGLTDLRADLAAVAPGKTTVSGEYEIDGEPRVAALTGLTMQDWVVAVIAPLAAIEAAAAPVPLITGGLIALVVLYAGLATAYLSRFVIRPIRELVRSSKQLAAGDLTVQVPVRGDDEVAQLASAFNSMASEIRGNTERLEGEVVRRTAQLEEANREITELSVTDALTGCHNRHFLDQQLPREVERAGRYARRLSVVMCDIDLFKSVNDRYGHAVGDAVLRAVGRYLETHRRAPDWVCRFGGEEFVIVLPETGLEEALGIAERTRVGLSTLEITVDGFAIGVTASLGVSTFRMGRDDTASSLLERSDEAMYRAKAAGRNQVSAELSQSD